MLLTTDDEIRSLMPTSKWNDVDMLLSCVEEEEQNVVLNLLGDELMDKFAEEYERMKEEYGGITPDILRADMLTDKRDKLTVRAIRLCQKVQLFLALAHNAGLLSVQLNSGGGLNQATAEYYDKADDKSVERFVKDAYMKAHRSADELLTLLERDARTPESYWAELWKKSRYYYEQSDMLLTTAMQMQYYLNIGGSRARFIELLPDQKFVQQHYVEPRIGHELTEAFIRYATQSDIIHAPLTEGISEAEKETEQQKAEKVWDAALNHLRMATAIFTEWRNPQLRRKESLDEANLSMAAAVRYINEHETYFHPYVESAPFYEPPVNEAQRKEDEKEWTPKLFGERPRYDERDQHNKATTIFGLGLMQH